VLSTATANALGLGLFTADILARTWRIQVLSRGLGSRTRFLHVFTLNAASDATAALTPLKVGGEPTRFGGLIKAGLNVSDTIALMSVETIIEWLVAITVGLWIGVHWGGEWWRAEQHVLVPHLKHAAPWVFGIVAIGIALWFLFRRFLPHITVHVGGTLRDSLRLARRMKVWAIAVSIPLTAVHIVARIAILPVIFATLADPPALGTMVVGSFALLYGQNFVPTPSGAGAVELGFLNGAAGYAGPDAEPLLLMWRFYTTLLGVGLGLVFGIPMYLPALHRIARRVLTREHDPAG
jgi:uncharacterized membrane protein YbhN (UPF0104 family)